MCYEDPFRGFLEVGGVSCCDANVSFFFGLTTGGAFFCFFFVFVVLGREGEGGGALWFLFMLCFCCIHLDQTCRATQRVAAER